MTYYYLQMNIFRTYNANPTKTQNYIHFPFQHVNKVIDMRDI